MANARRGVPFTSCAVNAVTDPLCAYASRFSGSVIVNVASGANVSPAGKFAYLPANRSAHAAHRAFVTVTATSPPVLSVTRPAPVNEASWIGFASGSRNVAPYATRTDVLLGTTPSVSAQSVPDSTAMP